MKKELFFKLFETYKEIDDKYQQYSDFMMDVMGEDCDVQNYYTQKMYEFSKDVFNMFYDHHEEEWFDYFLFETDMGKKNRDIVCKEKTYTLDSLESFYEFCENELSLQK